MGYRNYLYIMEKDELEKIHHMTQQEFYAYADQRGLAEYYGDEEPYVPLHQLGKEFFGFGKRYEHYREILNTGKPLFQDEELMEHYKEYVPYSVGKEAVLAAINCQKQDIIRHYEELLEPEFYDQEDRNAEKRFRSHIAGMLMEWKNDFLPPGACFALNMDEDDPTLTNSWQLEYAIFELVRLYKTTDWEKYGLIFMGW